MYELREQQRRHELKIFELRPVTTTTSLSELLLDETLQPLRPSQLLLRVVFCPESFKDQR
jgi:hypothetical protein